MEHMKRVTIMAFAALLISLGVALYSTIQVQRQTAHLTIYINEILDRQDQERDRVIKAALHTLQQEIRREVAAMGANPYSQPVDEGLERRLRYLERKEQCIRHDLPGC